MKMFAVLLIGLASIEALAAPSCRTAHQAGPVDSEWLSRSLEGFKGAAESVNRSEAQVPTEKPYTRTIPLPMVTDQAGSDTCWIHAAMNTLRGQMIGKGLVTRSFRFSVNHIAFFESLEVSRAFLNQILSSARGLRKGQELAGVRASKIPLYDGGDFDRFALMVERYGLVPESAMPSTSASFDLHDIREELRHILERAHLSLRDQVKGSGKLDPAKEAGFRDEVLTRVLEVLVRHLGKPPESFKWKGRELTPKAFAKDIVEFKWDDYVHLRLPDEDRPGKVWKMSVDDIPTTKDEDRRMSLEMVMKADEIKKIVARSIDQGYGVVVYDYFGGGMLRGFGLPGRRVTRKEMIETGLSDENHVSLIVGYNGSGKGPFEFLVMESFGAGFGDRGFVHQDRDWFDHYGYAVVVPKSALTPKQRKTLKDQE